MKKTTNILTSKLYKKNAISPQRKLQSLWNFKLKLIFDYQKFFHKDWCIDACALVGKCTHAHFIASARAYATFSDLV